MGWSDIPTCAESGIPIDQYQQPRTLWLPQDVPADAVAFYVDVLGKVRATTPEWKEYIERSAQTDRFLDRRRDQVVHRQRRAEGAQGVRAGRLARPLTVYGTTLRAPIALACPRSTLVVR